MRVRGGIDHERHCVLTTRNGVAAPPFFDAAAVRRALPMWKAIPLMAEAMRRFSGGRVEQPLRTITRPRGRSDLLGTMPCYIAGGDELSGFGLKATILKPENSRSSLPLHIGVIIVFDDRGFPIGIIDAGAVTAIRTAAVTAVATSLLSRGDATSLAILGSGVQARSHLEALSYVRRLRSVRAWSPSESNLRNFMDWARFGLSIDVIPSETPSEALRGAEIICAATSSREPLIDRGDLTDGAHLNLIGGSLPEYREATSAVVAESRVYVDSLESVLAESEDIRVPIDEGLIDSSSIIGEVGNVLLGRIEGRRTAGEVTVFKSVGLAVEDVISGLVVARSKV
ncbi:ornithine cyclodeaminase family protein [Nocardia terpenica]|nr:ornithine cyclodeaminase family protein [Nocardia terpenica]